jgi:uncharacterized damage-inducible protein DinB
MTDSGQLFLRESRKYLREDFLPRIAACLAPLGEEDIWWRPNEASNSIGNLVLHLAGNVRQWIVAGVGGTDDRRDRQAEFDQRDAIPGGELLARLRSVVNEAAEVIEGLTPAQLAERRLIQGYETTVLGAIYHVVEHFSMHTGQIILLTKARTGRDLGFYAGKDGLVKPSWPALE